MSASNFTVIPPNPDPTKSFTLHWEWTPSAPVNLIPFNVSISNNNGTTIIQIATVSNILPEAVCMIPNGTAQNINSGEWEVTFKHDDFAFPMNVGIVQFNVSGATGISGNSGQGGRVDPSAQSKSIADSSITSLSTLSSDSIPPSISQPSSQPAIIAGGVIGAVAFVALLALLFWWRFRRTRMADSAAKKELMSDGSFTTRGTNYQVVSSEASNDLLLRTGNIELGEKYLDRNSAQQSPVTQEPPQPVVLPVAPKPYKPLLQGPAESSTTTANVPYKQPSSQMRYVPAIAGPGAGPGAPGGASPPAPAHIDPYGDSKTQEDE